MLFSWLTGNRPVLKRHVSAATLGSKREYYQPTQRQHPCMPKHIDEEQTFSWRSGIKWMTQSKALTKMEHWDKQ